MLTTAVSLSYMSGDAITLEFAVTDEDGDAANITATTARFVVSRTLTADPVISTEASPATAVATITNAAGGIFQVAIDGDDTEDLSGTYLFETELEDASGDKATVARGYLTFKANLI